jgi:16S rRNA C1402 N4-methylase RsmH
LETSCNRVRGVKGSVVKEASFIIVERGLVKKVSFSSLEMRVVKKYISAWLDWEKKKSPKSCQNISSNLVKINKNEITNFFRKLLLTLENWV